MSGVKLSDIIVALEEIKGIDGDKEVCNLTITNNDSKDSLFVDFMDYTSRTVDIKSCNNCK
ncbi:hypothetical protein [Clostridium perfringens]|uniref:hypothetical protein n=1 Tax=Clostridium perfringens TaxID=1502 RepID=UPI001899B195|nr:hypothetical protein [Clostridium perfringens]